MLYLDYAKPVAGGGYILNLFADTVKDIEDVSNGKKFITKNGTDYGVPKASSTIVITYPDKTKRTYVMGEDGTWEEVGAGGGSGATQPNNIISETIVLTPENVKGTSGDSFSFVFTAVQTAQCLRANVIFLDCSALGAKFSTFMTMPLLRFDAGLLDGGPSTMFLFASGDIGGVFMINMVGVVQADGSSEVEMRSIETEPEDQHIPRPPYDDYRYSLIYRGAKEWGKPYETTKKTLLVSGWNVTTKTQNVNLSLSYGNLHDNDLVIVSPTGDPKDYADAGIYCSGQASNELTFTCETIPTKDIVVDIVVF